MFKASSKIIFILAAIALLGACAKESSDDGLTPEFVNQRIEENRIAMEEQYRFKKENPDTEVELPQANNQVAVEEQGIEEGHDNEGNHDGHDHSQGLTFEESQSQQVAPIPLPRPRPATPSVDKTQIKDISTSLPRGKAPESGKCKYVSGLSTPPPKNKVVLTFDDGPSSKLTPKLLDVLKKYRVQGVFFVEGDRASKNTAILKRIRDEGHIIGNHSWNHASFHSIGFSSQKQQAQQTWDVLAGVFDSVTYFRYPYGNSTCEMNAYLHKLNQVIVGWHIDSCDWAFANSGRVSSKDAEICAVSERNRSNYVGHVIQQVKNRGGGIVLMHDIHERTVSNVETIIQSLLQSGFEFGSLNDNGFAPSLR